MPEVPGTVTFRAGIGDREPMNYKFRIEDWLLRFPLGENAERYSGENVTSPCDVCNNELLRREMQDQYRWGPAVPVDIFVMAEGEPEKRNVTKIGALPYRPANASWPTGSNGQPMLFVAQFNFADSKDLTGELPGDILLVFADDSSDQSVLAGVGNIAKSEILFQTGLDPQVPAK